MDLALLGGRRGLRPNPQLQIELLELRLAHLAHPRPSQHADAYNAGGALILGRIQHFGQSADFLMGEEPFARCLDTFLEASGRIVRAPAPLDGKVEHFAQHFADAVGADGRGLAPLQLARTIVGLRLRWPRPALCDQVQKLCHIMRRDLCDQLVAQVRCDQFGQEGFMISRA